MPLPATLRQALAHHTQGQLQQAQRLYLEVLRQEPRHVQALHGLGVLAAQLGDPAEAVRLLDQALAIEARDPAIHHSRGAALQSLGRWAEALKSFEREVALKPASADAQWHRNRASLQRRLQHWDDALASYASAVAAQPDQAQLQFEYATLLQDLQRIDAALSHYDNAIALKPDYAEAYGCRGSAYLGAMRWQAALESLNMAIALKPDYAEAHCNRGAALLKVQRWQEALGSLNRAIELDARFAEAYSNRGAALEALGQWAAARADYDKALSLRPDFGFLMGHSLHAQAQLCDWTDWDAALAALRSRIERGEAACAPFPWLSLSGCAAMQRRAAEIWVRLKCPPDASLGALASMSAHEKIRIGYFSPDFRDHPVAHLTVGLIEAHDRSKFELTAFSFGPDTQDAMRQRLERCFDRFLDVRDEDDRAIVSRARSLQLDIAVDLAGFTKGSRPTLFALRAAPLQVGYLGYLGTMGAPYMDYLLADEVIVPEAARRHYSEQLLYLPCYQVNSSRERAAQPFTREALGLPARGCVFCCFNASYKISPHTFERWMRIVARAPGSVLLLLADNETMQGNLRRAAAAQGVDAARLIFSTRMNRPEYLARYQAADLFLDTLPYNAGTTASDALWMGLPVLSCAGETFAGRLAASLLSAVQLPELIAATEEQYEQLALDLAADPKRLEGLKGQLLARRLTAPLFDTALFTRHLEAAYQAIHARAQAGLAPATMWPAA